MRAAERVVLLSNASASATGLSLVGGRYLLECVGSNFGTVKLQKLGPDGATYLDLKAVYEKADGTGGTADLLPLASFSASGAEIVDLPPGGDYKATVSSATAVYFTATRIPLD